MLARQTLENLSFLLQPARRALLASRCDGSRSQFAAIGLAIGLPVAWIAAKAIQGLLFGVVSSDPATFGGVVTVVAIVAGLAGYVPARRASRIDPTLALRSD